MADTTREVEIPEPLILDGDALDPIGGGGALIGYARVSTTGQLLDRQLHVLTAVGCQKTFADKKSGKDTEREELAKCLEYMRAGDTLVVPSLDRLGWSLQDPPVPTLARDADVAMRLHPCPDFSVGRMGVSRRIDPASNGAGSYSIPRHARTVTRWGVVLTDRAERSVSLPSAN
ncbi:recombinase family protein [Nocardia sp. NPDC051981]|uniref:recombinase family protein n=1 Tax=Nocardia sp. NPDC051981 TaxID=3155417 RepID=UPI0034420382